MKLNFYYVKNGETIFDKSNRVQGNSDSPFTDLGKTQIIDLSLALSNIKFNQLYSSTNIRAIDTIDEISKYQEIKPIYLESLNEFHLGELEGELINDIKDETLTKYPTFDFTTINGENIPLFSDRITNTLNTIINSSKDNDKILIVSDSSFLYYLLSRYDLEYYDEIKDKVFNLNNIPNASITKFIYEDNTFKFETKPLTIDTYKALTNKEITFYYVRHGETTFNKKGIMQGQSGSNLTELGKSQAEFAKEQLKDIHFNKAYVSKLPRAIESASIILKDTNIPTTYDKRLIETSFGSAEGTTYTEENKKRFNETNWKDLGGESLEDVQKRMKSFFNDVIASSNDKDNILIVGHGDYYLILVETYFGISKLELKNEAEKNQAKRVPQGGIAIFKYHQNKMDLVHLMSTTIPKI